MRCLILFNPKSGRGKFVKKLPRIASKLAKRYQIETVATLSAEDMKAKMRETSADLIIVAGGDGSIHAAINSGSDKPLGILPAGTSNDIARSLGIARRASALKAICSQNAKFVDCLRVNGERTLLIAAAGAVTHLTYETPKTWKRRLGKLAYFLYGLRHTLKFPPFEVKAECADEHILTCASVVLAMNGKTIAGFPVNRDARMHDGSFELIIMRDFGEMGSVFSLMRLLFFGVKKSKKRVMFYRTNAAKIVLPEAVAWDLDGERRAGGAAEISVEPKSLRIFLPTKKKI